MLEGLYVCCRRKQSLRFAGRVTATGRILHLMALVHFAHRHVERPSSAAASRARRHTLEAARNIQARALHSWQGRREALPELDPALLLCYEHHVRRFDLFGAPYEVCVLRAIGPVCFGAGRPSSGAALTQGASHPFDDPQVPFSTVAQRRQRGLVGGAVMHGFRMLDAVELDQHGALG